MRACFPAIETKIKLVSEFGIHLSSANFIVADVPWPVRSSMIGGAHVVAVLMGERALDGVGRPFPPGP